MKLTKSKYAFRLESVNLVNLFWFSSNLSVLGIVVSIIGIIGIIVFIAWFSSSTGVAPGIATGVAGVLMALMIPYLIMWILLMIKSNKQDITGIEKIGKVYSYGGGSLEIIFRLFLIINLFPLIINSITITETLTQDSFFHITSIIGSVIYLSFVCLKIHGIRVENSEVIGAYLRFRYVLFSLDTIYRIITNMAVSAEFLDVTMSLFAPLAFFILDIGLTIILYSIKRNREKPAETENLMKNPGVSPSP